VFSLANENVDPVATQLRQDGILRSDAMLGNTPTAESRDYGMDLRVDSTKSLI
jgi:hypothetical protein